MTAHLPTLTQDFDPSAVFPWTTVCTCGWVSTATGEPGLSRLEFAVHVVVAGVDELAFVAGAP